MSDSIRPDRSSRTSRPFDRHDVDEETLTAVRADYETLSDLLRNPLDAPLAALALVLIVAGFAWQAVAAGIQYHPLVGGAVLVTGYLSYRVARLGWRVQNEHVATELARRDLRQSGSEE